MKLLMLPCPSRIVGWSEAKRQLPSTMNLYWWTPLSRVLSRVNSLPPILFIGRRSLHFVKLPIKNASLPPRFQVNTMFTRSDCLGPAAGVVDTSNPLLSEILILLFPKMLLLSDSDCEKSLFAQSFDQLRFHVGFIEVERLLWAWPLDKFFSICRTNDISVVWCLIACDLPLN